jgi:hypothetical protein
VKAEGWYVNEAGERFGRYATRLHFCRNRSEVKVEHTFIFTGTAQQDRLRDVGIALPLRQTKARQAYLTFGAEMGGRVIPVEGASSSDAHVYQAMDSPDGRRLEWTMRNGDTGAVLRHGERAAGLCRGNTDLVFAAAVIRDAWQQYPFEMEWNRGALTVHLWPRHGRLMDLTWDGVWYFLTDQQKKYMVTSKPKVGDKNYEPIMQKLRDRTAQGVAKTHEVWLFFDAPHDFTATLDLWDFVQTPVYAHADLEWQCASKALDWSPHQPYDMKQFPVEEDFLATLPDLVSRHADHVRYYGWWDWGAYHQFFETESPTAYGDSTFENTAGQPSWHRAKPKSHYQWGMLPWQMYFRTGDPVWRRYAQTYTLYSADRGFRHHSGDDLPGQEYPYDNSEVHWLGGWQGAPGGTIHIHNLLERNDCIYQYWLTGDRRPMDVLRMWAESYNKRWSPNEVYYRPDEALVGNNIRNTGGRLRRVVSFYEATWDERFRKHAENCAAVFPGAASADKVGDAVWFTTWMHEGLFRYWKVFGDERIRQAALSYCRYQSNRWGGMFFGGNESGILDWCAYGYEYTGDTLYLDLGRRVVDRLIAPWVSRRSLHPGAEKLAVVTLPRFMGYMAHAPAEWRARNLPTHERSTLDFHYSGRYLPKAPAILLLDDKDAEFSLEVATSHGGRFVLTAPDGVEAGALTIDTKTSVRGGIKTPRDGKSGVYALRCVEYPEKDVPPGVRPVLSVVRCDLDKVVYEAAGVIGAGLPARSWCFGVPAGAEKAAVHICPGIFETIGGVPYAITQANGGFRFETGAAGYAPNYTVAIPPAAADRVFRFGPVYRRHAVLPNPMSGWDPGLYFQVSGAPQVMSTQPEAWFAPGPSAAGGK